MLKVHDRIVLKEGAFEELSEEYKDKSSFPKAGTKGTFIQMEDEFMLVTFDGFEGEFLVFQEEIDEL